MEENAGNKKIDFFIDVLNMVRLLALYFCLYFISIFVLSQTPLRQQSQYISILSFAICGLVTFPFLPKEAKKIKFTCKRRGLAVLGILFLSVGATVLFNTLMNWISWDAILPENMQYSSEETFRIPFAVSLIGYGFVAPFAEEICFRGILFYYLKKWIKAPLAIFISALLFGLYHGNIMQGLYAFVMAVFMAFLVHKTGALSASILFHMVSNLTVTLYSQIPVLYLFFVSLPGQITAVALSVLGTLLLVFSFSAKEKEKAA